MNKNSLLLLPFFLLIVMVSDAQYHSVTIPSPNPVLTTRLRWVLDSDLITAALGVT